MVLHVLVSCSVVSKNQDIVYRYCPLCSCKYEVCPTHTVYLICLGNGPFWTHKDYEGMLIYISKETWSRDLYPLIFFMILTHQDLSVISIFEYGLDFVEIFLCEKHSLVSLTVSFNSLQGKTN